METCWGGKMVDTATMASAAMPQMPWIILALAGAIVIVRHSKQLIDFVRRSELIRIGTEKSSIELRLSQGEVAEILQDFLSEFTETYEELREEEKKLFREILIGNGVKTVQHYFPKYERNKLQEYEDRMKSARTRDVAFPVEWVFENMRAQRDRLRILRSINLIRPAKGASWKEDTIPTVSSFASYLLKDPQAAKVLLAEESLFAKFLGWFRRDD
jgi:hypothetical protein